jgi:hypothetical protein
LYVSTTPSKYRLSPTVSSNGSDTITELPVIYAKSCGNGNVTLPPHVGLIEIDCVVLVLNILPSRP